MSERTSNGRAAARRPAALSGPAVLWGASAIFLALLAVLELRVAQGNDPALRARAAGSAPPARRVLVRRIYERRVVVVLPPNQAARGPRTAQQVGAAGGYSSFAPTTRTS